MYKHFNINNYVKVKLNRRGIKIYIESLKNVPREYWILPETDENGYSMFQCWKLMEVFGEHMFSFSLPFSCNVLIDME